MGAAKLMQMLAKSGSVVARSLTAPQQKSVTSDVLKVLNDTVHKTRMKQAMFKQFQQVLELVAASTQTHSELRISLNILKD